MPSFKIGKLGLRFQKHDPRDHKLSFGNLQNTVLPKSFSLKDKINHIYDQGQLSSCTANAIAQQFRIISNNTVQISRLYQYFNSRLIEDTQFFDNGCTLRDCYKAIGKFNHVHEDEYPYIESNVNVTPPPELYIKANKNSIVHQYKSINNDLTSLKYVLAIQKLHIVFGAIVYDSIQHLDENFVVKDPDVTKDTELGGHALLLFSYDDDKQLFGICNSWSENYGDHGCMYMSYKYITDKNLCSDFWCISCLF